MHEKKNYDLRRKTRYTWEKRKGEIKGEKGLNLAIQFPRKGYLTLHLLFRFQRQR